MTGEIIIRQGPIPEGLPEDAIVFGYEVAGNAEMERLERIAIVYQLAMTLQFEERDWELLRMMAERVPPFDGMITEEYSIGYTGWEEDDGEGI